MSHFGERLRRAFGNAKNAEIARKLGVTESAVKNYIEGRIPDATRLLQIKDLTNCNLHWLLTGEEQPDTAPQKVLDLDSAFRDVVRRMIKEELALTLEPAQDIGSVDEFDLEAAVKKYDNALPVIEDWYRHEGLAPPTFQDLRFSGWAEMSLEEKVLEVRNFRELFEAQRRFKERARNAPKDTKHS